jgi:hypothetical protein
MAIIMNVTERKIMSTPTAWLRFLIGLTSNLYVTNLHVFGWDFTCGLIFVIFAQNVPKNFPGSFWTSAGLSSWANHLAKRWSFEFVVQRSLRLHVCWSKQNETALINPPLSRTSMRCVSACKLETPTYRFKLHASADQLHPSASQCEAKVLTSMVFRTVEMLTTTQLMLSQLLCLNSKFWCWNHQVFIPKSENSQSWQVDGRYCTRQHIN